MPYTTAPLEPIHAERESAIEGELDRAVSRAENNLAFARDLRTRLSSVLAEDEPAEPMGEQKDDAPTCELAERIRQITRVELLTQDVLTDIQERLQL